MRFLNFIKSLGLNRHEISNWDIQSLKTKTKIKKDFLQLTKVKLGKSGRVQIRSEKEGQRGKNLSKNSKWISP